VLLLVSSLAVFLFPKYGYAESSNIVRNFYVASKSDLGGVGYDAFSPQTLVMQQGDEVNITVRNTLGQSFQLRIEGEPAVTIQEGNVSAAGVLPADTTIPVFIASNAGIFTFYSAEHPEMTGQIVVLPSDWTNYNPPAQTRSFTQVVLPDFSGDGYDKFFPGLMVVNQGDTVNISIRNIDDNPHGFAMADYDLNSAVNPGQDLPNGTIQPLTTAITPFSASKAGVFSFLCTVPCGAGHFQMVGSLIVLPTGNKGYSPEPNTVYSYLTVKPDFAGDGYDKFLPDTIIVNQNDFVYIKVGNTDENIHGFASPDYNINNETIAPAQDTPQGLTPTDTYITPFFANLPGIHEFFCTNYCGTGHDQMIGYLVVLPTQNATTSPKPLAPSTLPSFLLVALSLTLLIVGLIIGIVVTVIFSKRESHEKK
jgi:heme/copper-type cytochrome/quinol oxidase subunit 2/plastocyanin